MTRQRLVFIGPAMALWFLFSAAMPGRGADVAATATPVINSGFLTSADIVNGGSGYVVPPTVTVLDATGSNAVIIAQIFGGVVTNFYINDPGRNYSSATTISVSPPHPLLRFSLIATNLILMWTNNSTLQSATSATGSYADVPSATSPYTNSMHSTAVRFYRLRDMVIEGGPPAPTDAANQTNCAQALPNPALSVSVTNGLTVDWYNAPAGGSLVAAGITTFAPTNNSPGIYSYYAEARIPGTSIVSTSRTVVTLTLNPRPTSTLLSLNATTCNIGTVYTLTNVLTGLGPWAVTWNDGTVQTVSVAGPGPVLATRAVIPRAVAGGNTVSNNVYYVTSVSNADTCVGNLPGDIIGTNTITVDPRPTSALSAFNATNCNVGAAYTLTNTLTGLGPWTLTWNDGTVQTVSVAGPGPVLATRTVIASVAQGANTASNNVYYVTSVSNADTCLGNEPGDIIGTNTITVDPRPTSTLLSLNATTCDVGAVYTLTNVLTGLGPWTLTWNDGTVQTVSIAGPGPVSATRAVIPSASARANTVSNNVYIVTSVANADTCLGNLPSDIIGTNTITVDPRPTSTLLSLNATTCDIGAAYTLTNVLTGLGPWTLTWNDGTIQTVSIVGPGPVQAVRTVIPSAGAGGNTASNNVYFVISVSNADTCLGNEPGDISGTNTVTVNPLPGAPTSPVNQSNCVGTVPNPALSVSVVAGVTADWYDSANNLVAAGTTTYVPANTAAGTYIYYAQSRNMTTGCVSANRTAATLTLMACGH